MRHIDPGAVVVAADGSPHGERAVRWAACQAHLEGRRLVVVTADGDDGRSVLDRSSGLARESFPGLAVREVLERGDPRPALLKIADRAHLLVVGSRGRGVVRSLLLGSVSASVSAHARCPVIVCRPAEESAPGRGVVVGADGTPGSRAVLEFAYRFAATRVLPLTVIHCYWDAVAAAASYREVRGERVEVPELDELRVVLSESVAGFRERFPEVSVTLELRHGLVDEALARRGQAWDLVVIGRHPMTTPTRIVTGSIATTVVERSRSTVAVVPEDGAADA